MKLTRLDLLMLIAEQTGLSRKDVRVVIEAMEDIVMETIANEDYIDFSFARIEGYTKIPQRINSGMTQKTIDERGATWSQAKFGEPRCIFTGEALETIRMNPKEFFELSEYRYTASAREYRQDAGLPEIPEYAKLSEDKIRALCENAEVKAKVNLKDIYQFRQQKKNRERKKQANILLMRQEDLDEQRKNGVAEKDLVHKSDEQLLKERDERLNERRENYYKDMSEAERRRVFELALQKRIAQIDVPIPIRHGRKEGRESIERESRFIKNYKTYRNGMYRLRQGQRELEEEKKNLIKLREEINDEKQELLNLKEDL